MRIAYYPGCSLHSTGIEYDLSTKKVCECLGIELVEVKDWVCCGASPAHQSNEMMALALPAKTLAQTAKTDGLKQVCVPCASCYSRLKVTQHELADRPDLRKDVEKIIGTEYPDDIEVLHMLDMITRTVGADGIAGKVVKNFNGIKVACYYGCLMTRPPKITGKKQFENPMEMESVLTAIGAETLDWNMKTFCCGAAFVLTNTDVALELIEKILADAKSVGAEMIAVGCPLCHGNLDTRQKQINKKFKTDYNIPIFYFTELLGLAMGIDAKELGINKHITDAENFLKERALI